ncbi:MAG: hypothetical protein ACLT38_10435 [Akkermansia sp.]
MLNRELFDEDGGMTPEELENALFINNMVVKASYQDYRLDNFSTCINEGDLRAKFKAYGNLSKIKNMYGRTRGSGKEGAREVLPGGGVRIYQADDASGAAVYRYIAGLGRSTGSSIP